MSAPPLDVSVFVEGTPVPKGSHSAFPIARGKCEECKPGKPCRRRNCFGGVIVGAVVTDSQGAELEMWQALVKVRAMSARNAAGHRMVMRPGALQLDLAFVMARPAGHWMSTGALSAAGRAQPLPTVKPDFDKLCRAVVDGLTEALVQDDAQVIVAGIALVYAIYRGWTGVAIRARQTSTYPAWVPQLLGKLWAPPDAVQGSLL